MKVNYLQIKHLLTTTLAILLLSSSTVYCMNKRETPETKELGGATYRIINANEHGTTINPKDVGIFNKYKDTEHINKRAQAMVEKILLDRGFIKGSPAKQPVTQVVQPPKVAPGRPVEIPSPQKRTLPMTVTPVVATPLLVKPSTVKVLSPVKTSQMSRAEIIKELEKVMANKNKTKPLSIPPISQPEKRVGIISTPVSQAKPISQAKNLTDKQKEEIAKSEEFIGSHTKKCPNCHANIEKNGGCRAIHCRCGAHFCWNCMQITGVHTDDHSCKNVPKGQERNVSFVIDEIKVNK